MVALQIREVPDEVRNALAERARERGQSLQAFLLALVVAEARRSQNASVLSRIEKSSGGTRVKPGETAAEVTADRRRRLADLDAG